MYSPASIHVRRVKFRGPAWRLIPNHFLVVDPGPISICLPYKFGLYLHDAALLAAKLYFELYSVLLQK
jgi:hypothetical protein